MELTFKNYCIVSLGKVEGILDIIKKLSEGEVKKLEQKGVLICTFSSVMSVSEIKESINLPSKTFFIFEVGNDTSAYKIGRSDIEKELFDNIEKLGSEHNDIMAHQLSSRINEDINTPESIENRISKLSKKEVEDEIDNLLDKGLDNLDNSDKEIWELLVKRVQS